MVSKRATFVEETIPFKTLINSTLSSLLVHCMSLFDIPKSVVLRPEKVQRDFRLRKRGFGQQTLSNKLVSS